MRFPNAVRRTAEFGSDLLLSVNFSLLSCFRLLMLSGFPASRRFCVSVREFTSSVMLFAYTGVSWSESLTSISRCSILGRGYIDVIDPLVDVHTDASIWHPSTSFQFRLPIWLILEGFSSAKGKTSRVSNELQRDSNVSHRDGTGRHLSLVERKALGGKRETS